MTNAQPISIISDFKTTLKATIFAIPKAFEGKIGIIQRNAILSWTKLQPKPEIILLGNEPGTAKIAQELGLHHVAEVKQNQQGTPLLNDIFAKVHRCATHSVLTYVNCDIILTSDFLPSVEQAATQHPLFLILGRRWNLDINEPINFEHSSWEKELRDRIQTAGIFSAVGALDYFVFPKPLFSHIPDFAVGRAGWDSWMVGEALKNNYAVINASQTITAIHQNHDYNHLQGRRLEAFFGKEAQHNQTWLQGHFAGNSADATWYLTPRTPEQTPQVSIVISTHQQNPNLKRAIDSILQQTSIRTEIILVEETSQDNINSILPPEQQLIKWIKQPQQGILNGWNQGLNQAQAEFMIFLNADDYFLADQLQKQVQCFAEKAGSLEFVLAGWQVVNHQGEALETVQPWQRFAPILQGREGLHGFHVWMLPSLWQMIETSALMFRRSWVLKCGGFDPQLSSQASILDLLLKLSAKGAAGFCLEQITVCCSQRFPHTLNNKSQIEQESKHLIDNYFTRPTLREWMRPLEPLAHSTIKDWLATHP